MMEPGFTLSLCTPTHSAPKKHSFSVRNCCQNAQKKPFSSEMQNHTKPVIFLCKSIHWPKFSVVLSIRLWVSPYICGYFYGEQSLFSCECEYMVGAAAYGLVGGLLSCALAFHSQSAGPLESAF